MASNSFQSVGRKTALAVGLATVATLLIGLGLTRRQARNILDHHAVEEAARISGLIARGFEHEEPGANAPPAPHRAVGALLAGDDPLAGDGDHSRVIGRDGKVRWSQDAQEIGRAAPDAARLLAAPEGGFSPGPSQYVLPLGGARCAGCHGTEAPLGAVQVAVAHTGLTGEASQLLRAQLSFFAGALAVLLVVIFVSLRKLVIGPIERLTEVMRSAEKGDFLVRAQVSSSDEIGRLAQAFNSMLSRITELKVAEIEASREMESMHRELALKEELEKQHTRVEEANRALSRRVREVTLLLDITRSLNSSLEIEEILNLVTEMVGVTLGVDQFTAMLLDEDGETLRVAASYGFRDAPASAFRLSLGEGASGIAAQTREAVYIADLHTDPRYVPGPCDPAGDGSLLCVPMICKDQIVGVLNFTRLGRSAFSENDLMLLQVVGSQAAMAIINARLFSTTKELTLTDSLTGVFNRRALFARLEMELARAQRFQSPMSLVMVDIDHFKHLNDTCGHSTGDEALRTAAELLKRTVRKVDAVARYGGEEFVVLLPQVGPAEALEVGEKLRRAFEQIDIPGGSQQPEGRLTVSAGVATFPAHAADLEALVDAADAALYASKRLGRNRVSLFEAGMETHPGRERGPGKRSEPQLAVARKAANE